MIRHTRPSGRRDSGVTLMELLVTIVIATIFFTAAVPVFVGAIKASSLDRVRVVAVNAAQDRIELIHNLHYDLITPSYLGSKLGTEWTAQSSAGPRTLTVSYGVTTSAASGTSAGYKVVTLTVGWTGNPQPVSPIVLNTIVYAQYAGPQISNFAVTPFDEKDELTSQSNTTLTATINAASASIDSMQTVTIGGQPASGYVTFAISSDTGTVYPSTTVYYGDPGCSGDWATYTSTWTSAPPFDGKADGVYSFTATAYSSSGTPGNTWTIRKRIESGNPAPVDPLAAVGTTGEDGVVLTWTPSVTGDVVNYVVTRLGGSESFTSVTLPATATGYVDPPSSASADSLYTYTVTAVDWIKKSAAATTSVTWALPLLAPNPATNLAATQTDATNATVNLTWSEPASIRNAIGGYYVYADGGATPIATVNTTSTTVTASQLSGMTWNGTYWFQVKPFLQATGQVATSWATLASAQASYLDPGTGAAWANVALGSPPAQTPYTNNLTANFTPWNSQDKATIELIYLGSTDSGSGTSVGVQTGIAANSTASWTSLAAGWYRISYTTHKLSSSSDHDVTGSTYTQPFNMIP